MLDSNTKKKIDDARDILVGKVPVPSSQVEQITIALIYKFMYDMDNESIELGGNPKYFTGDYAQYAWNKLFDPKLSGEGRVMLYQDALIKIRNNPQLPTLFSDIFKNAFLPYRDPETLKLFLKCIDEFTYEHSEKLGDAFEYLLAVLGSQGDAGQFRTPRHIIDFIVALIDPKKEDSILDPACGTAGFLISAYKHIIKTNSSNYDKVNDPHTFVLRSTSLDELVIQNGKKYTGDLLTPDQRAFIHKNIKGYDITFEMVRLSLVNMYLHGFNTPQIYEYDTLTFTDRWNEYASVILANPPFMTPKGGIRPHQRFTIQAKRSEVLFVDYMLEHLTTNGKAGIIVPEGIIFQSGNAYKQLRKLLVEENFLVGVISLPAGVFNPYSGVKTSILWIDKALAKKTDKIIFLKINADGFDLGAQRRPIDANDLPAAYANAVAYKNAILSGSEYQAPSENVFLVEKAKLAERGEYNLSGERYIKLEVFSSNYKNVRLKEVAEINPSTKRLDQYEDSDSVSFLPMSDLSVNAYLVSPKQERKLSDVRAGYSYFENLDILLAKITPCFENGKIGIASNLNKGIGFGSTEYHVIRCGKSVLPHYLYHLLNRDEFRMKAKTQMTGSAGQQRIPQYIISEQEIPLPPLSVQEEIVAELDSYQKIIDGAKQVVDNWKPHIDIDPAWQRYVLNDLCYIDGLIESSPSPDGIYIGADSIEEGTGRLIKKESIKKQNIRGAAIRFYGKKILYSKLRPYLNKVTITKFDGYCSTDIYPLSCYDSILYEYLYYILRSDTFLQTAIGLQMGARLPRINKDQFLSIKISVPNLYTQQVIVDRIEDEKKLIDSNRQIIILYEQKINDCINKLWNFDKGDK